MTYTGTIVEESLKDNRFVNELNVIGVSISPNDRWHLYKVEIDEAALAALAEQLKPEKWYMHFWNSDNVIVVYPSKIFRLEHSDKATWQDAIDYGLSINVPREQLDFVIDE